MMDREKALQIIWDRCQHSKETEKALEVLKEERKQGKWIDHSDEGYVECPFCEHATNCDDNIEELHYCFFCGASLGKKDKTRYTKMHT